MYIQIRTITTRKRLHSHLKKTIDSKCKETNYSSVATCKSFYQSVEPVYKIKIQIDTTVVSYTIKN